MLRSPSHSSNSNGNSPSASPSKASRLGIASVAHLFVRMKRLEKQSKEPKLKPNQTFLSSGEPKTHPNVASGTKEEHQIPVEFIDHYLCTGGVNVATLVRATRSTLIERIHGLGANSLVDEEWECLINSPKPHQLPNGTYKVQVRYLGSAVKCSARDPQRPVALDKAQGIPGLMTIIRRNDD